MKKNQTIRIVAIFLALIPVAFSACVKDKCKSTYTYTWYEPVYKTKAEVRDNIKSNPAKDIVHPGKMFILGDFIFLNEVDKGVHVINNVNPASPRQVAFIDIPGNLDIALKGTTMYADLYTDLVAIDITYPDHAVLKKVIEGQFPFRAWGNGFVADNDKVIIDWKRQDTTVTESCDKRYFGQMVEDMGGVVFFANQSGGSLATGANTSSPVGIGGSMARFTIMNDRLYTVSYSDLDVFNITNTANPTHTSKISVGWNIETVYPFKNNLFIGSQSGMYIYNVSNPDAPVAAGQFQHVRTCDPVIADDTYAYVTLSSGTSCQGFTNELDILKLNNITDPQLVKVYPMTNPKGLSKSGNHLFICDGDAVKVFNASNVTNLQLVQTIASKEPHDIIAYNNVALVVAKDGLYQYNYADISNIRLLSKITVSQ
jgi:hypothetical protein